MSSYKDLCCQPSPCFPDICPEPCAVARNDLCITSCGDSTAVIYPPPVSVHFPGPVLATNPQNSFVGSTLPAIPYGASGSSGGGILRGSTGYGGGYDGGYGDGYGGAYGGGYGGLFGYGGLYGYGGLCGYGGSYGYGGLCGYGRRYGRKLYSSRYGSCGPC